MRACPPGRACADDVVGGPDKVRPTSRGGLDKVRPTSRGGPDKVRPTSRGGLDKVRRTSPRGPDKVRATSIEGPPYVHGRFPLPHRRSGVRRGPGCRPPTGARRAIEPGDGYPRRRRRSRIAAGGPPCPVLAAPPLQRWPPSPC